MNTGWRFASRSNWAMSVCILLTASGCASYTPSAAPQPRHDTLAWHEAGGLSAAAVPYVDKEAQKANFDADLDAADVLAILVVARNGGGDKVLVRPADMTLRMPDGSSIGTSSAAIVANKVGESGSVVAAAVAFGLIGVLVAGSAEDKAKATRTADYAGKALNDSELGPQASAQGFVYFLPPKSTPAFDTATLVVSFVDIAQATRRSVEIPLAGLSFEPGRADD